MRVALYREMSVFCVLVASSGVRKYLSGNVRRRMSLGWDLSAYQKWWLFQVKDFLHLSINLANQCLDAAIESCSLTTGADGYNVFFAAN